GATAGISADQWTAELYVENLTDERAEVSGNAIFNRARVTMTRPRTMGLRFTYDF
ncbi:MAG: outer membrane receptor protein involved in Fe transport, partial [Alcanivorax sp.]